MHALRIRTTLVEGDAARMNIVHTSVGQLIMPACHGRLPWSSALISKAARHLCDRVSHCSQRRRRTSCNIDRGKDTRVHTCMHVPTRSSDADSWACYSLCPRPEGAAGETPMPSKIPMESTQTPYVRTLHVIIYT